MSKYLLYPLLLLMTLSLSLCSGSENIIRPSEQPDENESNIQLPKSKGRYLVLFCSRSGITESITKQIQATLNCDIQEVVPAISYEDDYDAMLERAQREQAAIVAGSYPAIKTSVETFEQYEKVFIGYPIWRGHRATSM